MSHDSFDFLGIPSFHQFWNPTQFRDPLSFGIPDEPPCYVGQYRGKSFEISLSSFSCLGVNILCLIVCTAIHNCSSSGSIFFVSLRWNN